MSTDFREYFKLVIDLEEDKLKKALELVLHPPIILLDPYKKHIRGYSENFPPQPRIEHIPIELIKKVLGEDGVKIFLAVDQVVSLMPRSVLRDVNKLLTSGEGLEMIRSISRKLYNEYSEVVNKIRIKDLLMEDYRKERILLILPSWRQLEIVRGRWRELAWREKTLKGEETPNPEGWIRDILSLADLLKSEGIKITIVADSILEGKLPVGKNEAVFIEIYKDLCKIGYSRDSSMTWLNRPIISNMALPFRRGEEEVIADVYWRMGLTPIMRLRWAELDGMLKRVNVEGGNFFMIGGGEEAALITGIGVRGTDVETFMILDKIMPRGVRFFGVPLGGYLKDWVSGVVHLDVVFTYLGELSEGKVVLIDPSRMGFYSILEYDRVSGSIVLKSFIELAKDLELLIDEPPKKTGSPITMVNALNLGGGKLVVDSYNREVNNYIEKELGADLIEVDIPHIEAGGGGPRCATRDIPP
ncbi:MAG: hypothetical protein N3G77_07190 [Nitrososphaeria archaeon]|nr:hypothetical protein [Nitrososphaeria archaeon]